MVLPEQSVIDAITTLSSKPRLLRTDKSDKTITACEGKDANVGRIGIDESKPGANDDTHPGGCDNYILQVR